MKTWQVISQVVLTLSLLRLGAIALLPFLTPVPDSATAGVASNLNPNARRVSSVEDDLSLVLSESAQAPATTVKLSCLTLFPDPSSRLEAKRRLITLLTESEGYVYLDDPLTTERVGETLTREVHLTTGTFVQTELAASGWVKFKPGTNCRAQETIALASRKAQQQRLGGWKR